MIRNFFLAALMLPAVLFGQAGLKDLKYPALRAIEIPKIETATLPNGMQVMLLENHELPLVRGTALVRTGNLFDPLDKVGLATMTGTLIRSGGTKSKSGDELDEQLENIAASVESDISESTGTVSFSCLKENTDEVLGIFSGVLTAPEFREDKVDLAKNQLRSGIARRNDDASGIAGREFAALLYGHDNTYGADIEYATVDKIQRADLIAFYTRYFFPGNIILAVQGDFSAADMKAKLEKVFAAWTVTQPKVPPFPAVKKQNAGGMYVAVKTDVTQTNFTVGQLGGTLDDKDYPALEVMADILGGGFHSRLFQIIRSQLGYAYSVSSSWGANYDHPGLFEISGSTKSASTIQTFKVIQEQVQKIRTSLVTAEELETSKSSVANSFVFHFDTPSKTLNRLLLYKYFNYPDDFLFRYQKAIAAVTPADVLRVAKERLDPKSLTMLAVGNPKEFGTPLSSLGMPVKELDIIIPEPKGSAATAVDPGSLTQGKELLQKVQAAVGGTDKLMAVKDLTLTLQLQVDAAAGGLKAEQVNQWIAPSHFRQDAKYPFGAIAVYFDGASGWMSSPQGTAPMPEAQRNQVSGELFRLFVPLLLSDHDAARKVNLAADSVLEISDASGHAVRLTIDPKTGLPSKEEFQQAQPNGPPGMVSLTFSEYGTFGGIQLPRRWTIFQNGKKYAESTLISATFNTGLKLAVISRQP